MKSALLTLTALAAGTVLFGVVPRGACEDESKPPVISFGAFKLLEDNVEGPDVERTYFTVGSRRIVYGVPKGCRLGLDGDGFVLTPTEGGPDGVIYVGRSPFTPQTDLAENALKYRDTAAEKIPRGAEGVEVQPPVMNPYPFNGWKSIGFTWKYTFYGRPLHRTVSYINLEIGAQIMVTTESAQADAEKVDKLAQQFMSSWWVMKGDAKAKE